MKIEAYVVVCDDDKLCDANGEMPDVLKNDAEWEFFQAGLDQADVSVIGRKSHEATPNHKNRNRLVLSRSVSGVVADGKIVTWNPDDASLDLAIAGFDCEVSHLAVTGGQAVFDFFLAGPHRYTRFHLSRVRGVRIAGGRAVFSRIDSNSTLSAEDVLKDNGYKPLEKQILDEGVDVVSWG